jgi:hypothetical protein
LTSKAGYRCIQKQALPKEARRQKKLGFIGLGAMGARMARDLLKAAPGDHGPQFGGVRVFAVAVIRQELPWFDARSDHRSSR